MGYGQAGLFCSSMLLLFPQRYEQTHYFVEISLFTGKRKPLKIREVLKIAQYILSEIGLQSVKAWVRREKRRLSRRLIMET